ncbi:MAG TPA: transglutaminase domain-containing protein [Terriglobales bacterium]|nr:transglutaminase domain-containing protein [Terriglobales bacterium]
MFSKAAAFAFCLLASLNLLAQTATRHFTFHYAFVVRNTSPGARLRVWIPLAHSDANQQVKVISIHSDLPVKRTVERAYGNRMLYAETAKATASDYRFAIDYDVERKERAALANSKPVARNATVTQADQERFLQPDRLVPVSGVPAQIAARQVAGARSELERSRALYNYVLRNMRYDKTGTGWGHGDVLYACNARKGNCTDFHSLFISLARSQGIPARFEIGFPLPADQRAAEIPGYHCWADFYLHGAGWVPVDISEAWQQPDKRDYFFGALDANRMQFTLGRDLILSPRQDGEPLNYFIYPYVEMNGREYHNISNNFSFTDVRGTISAAGK